MTAKEAADSVLLRLEAAGYEAWAVGGCVRDTLLGRTVHDWDMTTSATPRQVLALFSHCVPTGLRHGTVTVLESGYAFEVTTYRAETGYSDGRHPDAVSFVGTLEEDLARRDFTVNAMALDVRGRLVDLHGGREDLQNRLLRCVGEPERRFREDALRMLRAVRFSAQLGFTIEPETRQAMAVCADGCAVLSAERIRDEVEKTLRSPEPQRVLELLEYGMLRAVGLEPGTARPWPAVIIEGSATAWAVFRLAVPDFDPTAMRLDKKTGRLAVETASLYGPELTMARMKRVVAGHGWAVGRCLCTLYGQVALAEELEQSGDCVTLAQLAITGRDLPVTGPAVGLLLRQLLNHVLEVPADNERTRLLELAAAWKENTL
ncbi:CCA tRNA nucleotidyltransferase [Candidatus Avoscillospira sp. LCP25S3_F1]|uniref:CCA tRNA nucleotidyltransferase n=1 Tax=Candidatus Avoscillospira sp. LCP25S3_F1 TaxID=3438825 RepID=UPI003F92F1B1